MALTQVSSDGVKNDAISHNKIPANAIQASELADNAVDTAAIADDAVTSAKIVSGGVQAGNINSNAVSTGALQSNAVTTNKIADSNVTTAKIADDAVTQAKIAANAVDTTELAVGAVTHDQLADNTVDADHLQSNAVTTAKIADGAVTQGKIPANAIGTAQLRAAEVTSAKIAAQAVTLDKLPHGTSSNNGKFLRANNGADPTFETVTGTTINNQGDNKVLTSTATSNTIQGEDGLQWNGTDLDVSSGNSQMRLTCSSNTPKINFDANNVSDAARITISESSGGGVMRLHTKPTSSTLTEIMRLQTTGQVSLGHSSYLAEMHPAKLVVHPNIHDSSLQSIGILVDGDGGTGGGVSQPAIGIKCVNTNTWNNATHQYGIYNEVGQQYVSSGTGIYNKVSGLYGTTTGYHIEMNKNLNAYTNAFCLSMNLKPTGSGGTAYFIQAMKDDSHLKMRVLQNGNLQNANNSYGSTSDVKLKENIENAKSQWDDIKALTIRNFIFKDDPDRVKMIGVVAQEVEKISAGLVETENDLEIDKTTGEGKVVGTTKFVKYSILYMKAVKALQEAMEKIEVLETKVAALEAK